MAFCLLSVIRKQHNYSVDQSELLKRFRTDFTSSARNFCRWGAEVPPGETSLAAKSEEKRLYSQVTGSATAAKLSLKKWIHILSIFIAIIPTHLLCEMQENSNNRKWLTKRYLSRNPLKMWTNVWPIISITCGKKRQSLVCWKWEATNKMHHQKAHRNMK